MTKYNLINPTIVGTFDSSVNAKSSKDAVSKIWSRLSEHIMGNVPDVAVTLQEGSSGKLHHFRIQEKVNDQKEANIKYTELKVTLTKEKKDKLLSKNKSLHAQAGGGKKKKKGRKRYEDDDSSSSSSDSDDEYYKFLKRRKSSIIELYAYNPYYYDTVVIDQVFIPTWKNYMFAYNEVWVGF